MKFKEVENKIIEAREIFKKNDVIFAYLFGSVAKGNVSRLSDIDVAVYFNERLTPSERFSKKLRIMAELSFFLKEEKIDVVILNDSYPLLEHRIIKDGKVIFSCDEKKRLDYELKAVLRYLDFKPYIEKYTKETIYGQRKNSKLYKRT